MSTQTFTKGQRDALRKLIAALEEFRKLDPDMTIQQGATLAHIALHEGMSVGELTQLLGIASSTASRNVAALGKQHRLGKKGHDCVQNEVDPMERRRRILTLTHKGRRVVNSLIEAMGG